MTFLELLVFAVFFAFICWLLWRALEQERKLRQAMIDKEARQTLLYERLIVELEKYNA